jgi:hypothetical protein
VLFVPEMLGHLLIQRGFQHGLREQLQQPIGPIRAKPCSRAWATIAATVTCSGDSRRPVFLIFA